MALKFRASIVRDAVTKTPLHIQVTADPGTPAAKHYLVKVADLGAGPRDKGWVRPPMLSITLGYWLGGRVVSKSANKQKIPAADRMHLYHLIAAFGLTQLASRRSRAMWQALQRRAIFERILYYVDSDSAAALAGLLLDSAYDLIGYLALHDACAFAGAHPADTSITKTLCLILRNAARLFDRSIDMSLFLQPEHMLYCATAMTQLVPSLQILAHLRWARWGPTLSSMAELGAYERDATYYLRQTVGEFNAWPAAEPHANCPVLLFAMCRNYLTAGLQHVTAQLRRLQREKSACEGRERARESENSWQAVFGRLAWAALQLMTNMHLVQPNYLGTYHGHETVLDRLCETFGNWLHRAGCVSERELQDAVFVGLALSSSSTPLSRFGLLVSSLGKKSEAVRPDALTEVTWPLAAATIVNWGTAEVADHYLEFLTDRLGTMLCLLDLSYKANLATKAAHPRFEQFPAGLRPQVYKAYAALAREATTVGHWTAAFISRFNLSNSRLVIKCRAPLTATWPRIAGASDSSGGNASDNTSKNAQGTAPAFGKLSSPALYRGGDVPFALSVPQQQAIVNASGSGSLDEPVSVGQGTWSTLGALGKEALKELLEQSVSAALTPLPHSQDQAAPQLPDDSMFSLPLPDPPRPDAKDPPRAEAPNPNQN